MAWFGFIRGYMRDPQHTRPVASKITACANVRGRVDEAYQIAEKKRAEEIG
jgi:hypothetical protein